MKKYIILIFLILLIGTFMNAQETFEKDIIKTSKGDLKITFIGHASLMIEFDNKIIHIDPYSSVADYSKLPKADLLLLTHEHNDHFDGQAIRPILKATTKYILTETCANGLPGGIIMKNNEVKTVFDIEIKAVPAYNIVHTRGGNKPYHPKEKGNGYIIKFGDKNVYIAGDTENIPEMKALKDIDIAFLPMNLPFTMTPEMVADAAKAFKPKILYPYHYANTNPSVLENLLEDSKEIEVRIRKM